VSFLAAEHEFGHESLDGFHHLISVSRAAAEILRISDKRGDAMSHDHVTNKH
jgi:hypothetical protein